VSVDFPCSRFSMVTLEPSYLVKEFLFFSAKIIQSNDGKVPGSCTITDYRHRSKLLCWRNAFFPSRSRIEPLDLLVITPLPQIISPGPHFNMPVRFTRGYGHEPSNSRRHVSESSPSPQSDEADSCLVALLFMPDPLKNLSFSVSYCAKSVGRRFLPVVIIS